MHGSANKLKTARNIALTGDVSGNVNFDGSNNVEINTITTTRTTRVTVTKNGIDFILNFKRTANLVTLNVEMFIPSTVTMVSNWLTYQDFTMPQWAKTSDNTVKNLDFQFLSDGMTGSTDFVAFSACGRVGLVKQNTNDYRLMYSYMQADNVSYPDGHILNFNLKYIVED